MKILETLMLVLGPTLILIGAVIFFFAWRKPSALQHGFFKSYFPVPPALLSKVYFAQACQTTSIGIWLLFSALDLRLMSYIGVAFVLLSSFWLGSVNRKARQGLQT